MSPQCTAGLTALRALSLISCSVTLTMPDPMLDRLTQILALELCAGTLEISSKKSRRRAAGEPAISVIR